MRIHPLVRKYVSDEELNEIANQYKHEALLSFGFFGFLSSCGLIALGICIGFCCEERNIPLLGIALILFGIGSIVWLCRMIFHRNK